MHGEPRALSLSTHLPAAPSPIPLSLPSFLSLSLPHALSFFLLPLSFLGTYTDPISEKLSWGVWRSTIPSLLGLTVFSQVNREPYNLGLWQLFSLLRQKPHTQSSVHKVPTPWASLRSSLSPRRPSPTPCWPWPWSCTCQFCCGSTQLCRPSAQTCCSSSANWTNPTTAPSAWYSTC